MIYILTCYKVEKDMERCSFFIEDKALFGSFPDQTTVETLEETGVRCFVDLTDPDEHRTTPYTTKYKYIKYPIPDRKVPKDWKSFAQLIIQITSSIKSLGDKEMVYVHCKGGHGRSGVVVACVLCYYYNIHASEALSRTRVYHSQRKIMRDKWRRLGSPQGKAQKDFVHRFFRFLKYGQARRTTGHDFVTDFTVGMDNLTDHPVTIPVLGTFPDAYHAFQAYRNPKNKVYIEKLRQGKFCPDDARTHEAKTSEEWEEKKITYMYRVLEYKFRQHESLRLTLMNTGLRPLVKISHDEFWGSGVDGRGKNMHGKLLGKLRVKFLVEDYQTCVAENA